MAQNPKPDDIPPDAVLKDEAQDTPSNPPDDRGGLPEGVRGTTRDPICASPDGSSVLPLQQVHEVGLSAGWKLTLSALVV